MGYPGKRFAEKTAKFVMTALATTVIFTASSSIAHAKKTESIENDKNNIIPPYAAQADTDSKEKYKHKNRRIQRNPDNLRVSEDFKFYKQVASLDLTDPVQAETFLQFMDIRLAEKELNEEVVLVKEETKANTEREALEIQQAEKKVKPDPDIFEIKQNASQDKKGVNRDKSIARSETDRRTADRKGAVTPPVRERFDNGRKTGQLPGSEESVEQKEKEQARIERATERRKARQKQLAEKKDTGSRVSEKHTVAEEPVEARKRKAEALRLAEEKSEAEEKERTGTEKPEEKVTHSKQGGEAEESQKYVIDILPSRPISYQIASSEEDPKIINFDQSVTRRFKATGSYLYQGENGDNIVKDKRGREFLNVMAFWDVLVEPLSDGDNRYYGSIQFPLGSRHPAIINSTKPGDMLALGCQANEVVVLKSFETEGVDYSLGLVDAYLAYSTVMPDGTVAFQEVVRQPSFSLINVETDCMSRDMFSRSDVDPERMGHDKTLHALPVRE